MSRPPTLLQIACGSLVGNQQMVEKAVADLTIELVMSRSRYSIVEYACSHSYRRVATD